MRRVVAPPSFFRSSSPPLHRERRKSTKQVFSSSVLPPFSFHYIFPEKMQMRRAPFSPPFFPLPLFPPLGPVDRVRRADPPSFFFWLPLLSSLSPRRSAALLSFSFFPPSRLAGRGSKCVLSSFSGETFSLSPCEGTRSTGAGKKEAGGAPLSPFFSPSFFLNLFFLFSFYFLWREEEDRMSFLLTFFRFPPFRERKARPRGLSPSSLPWINEG